MTDRPMTPRELVAGGGRAEYERLAEIFGPELLARLLDLERDVAEQLARELPDADADQRAWWACQLAHVVATDSTWFGGIVGERPGRQAKALARVHQAARQLLEALDDLPEGAVCGTHMRLLMLDLPPPAARQALNRELVYRTWGKVDAGLNRRRAAVAELALAAAETREGIRAAGGGKHRADRLARHVADAFKALGAKATVSGSGEGPYPRAVAEILAAAGIKDASAADVARREAERRRDAAAHSGGNDRDLAKISTGRRAKS